MKRGFNIAILISGLLAPFLLLSQEVKLTVEIDSANARIGEHRTLSITAKGPIATTLILPVFKDTINSKIEILRIIPPDTLISGQERIIRQQLVITSFDSGYHVIAPIILKAISESNDTLDVQSEAFLFYVQGVELDENADIRDIKPPLRAPYTLRELLPWLGIALLGALLVIAWFYYRRYSRKKTKTEKTTPLFTEPPHITALRELEKLREARLWEKGDLKGYYTRLTDIIRTYIEHAQGVAAIEMTTDEIISALRQKYHKEEWVVLLRLMMQTADMVKFAKALPLPDSHDTCFKAAVRYVNETAMIVEPHTDENESAPA